MPLSQATLDQVQQLIAADAGLQSRLQAAGDVTQAVEMIVAAAAAKGLRVEPSELSAHLAAAIEAASAAALSDAQLESVAGGLAMNREHYDVLSLLTFGVGCLINSLANLPLRGGKHNCSNVS